MFEKATRLKIRFETSKGLLSVEDLWDLPLTSANGKLCLDEVAKGVNQQLKESSTESFVEKTQQADPVLELKLDIVKHVISVRLDEADKAEQAKVLKGKKDRIMTLIAQKKDEVLAGSSIGDLEKMLEELCA